jgi:hypothetical protein
MANSVVPVVVVGGLVVLGIVVISSKKSAAKTASSGGSGSSSISCVIDAPKLHAWGLDHGMVVLWLFTTETPPSIAELENMPAWASSVANKAYNKIVVVTKSENFWSFDTKGDPVAAPQLKDSYCSGKAPEKAQIMYSFFPVPTGSKPVQRMGE